MKLAFNTTFLMALTASAALLPQKSVIVSYGSNTPASVVQQAKDAITAAGGVITHEYSFIKAFAAKATTDAVNKISALGSQYNFVIEEDQIVQALEPGRSG